MNPKFIFPILLFSSLASQTTLATTQVDLVIDIWQDSESSVSTSPVITINNKAFFFANDGEYGKELWQTDGTTIGTKLFKDILPGSDSSNPIAMTLVGESIFLITETVPYELIKIDSTTGESTVLITSNERTLDSIGNPFANLVNIDDTLFFSLYSSDQEGYQPWESDGTLEGTKQISNISINAPIDRWNTLNNNVIFTGRSTDKLWLSTRQGAVAVEIDGEFNYVDSQLIKRNNALFFISDSRTHSAATLRKYEGTGVSLVKIMEPNAYLASQLINVNGTLFFTLRNRNVNNQTTTLWKSDGTADGTSLLKTIPNPNNGLSFFKSLTYLNDTIFFTAGNELWKSDGTENGTILVQKFPQSDGSLYPVLRKVNDSVFLINASRSNEIRKLDESGELEQYVLPDEFSMGFQSDPVSYFTLNDILFSFLGEGAHGKELFKLKNDPIVESAPPTCEAGVDPQTIRAGEGTALWGWSDTALTASINQDIGSMNLPTDFKWIYPEETTTYTLTATGQGGTTTTCDATIIVEGQIVANPPDCEMGADPQIIRPGQGTALWWWSDNVSSASIDNDMGSVTTMTDYKWFYPTQTATYTMTAVSENGASSTCKTTIEVTNRH